MANGDIKSVSINTDGWTANVIVEAAASGGTYDFGFGTYNDPSTAKIVFGLTSEGYNNSGTLGTKSRTVYGEPCQNPALGAMRKADPNDASPNETASGSDLLIKVALSEFIYNDDTSVTVDFASGWYTSSGTASNSCNDLVVTNSSTLDYPRVVGNWVIPQRQVVIGTTLRVEFTAFHKFGESGKPVACVKFTATDDHSNSVTSTVTSMTASTDSPYGKILVYQADMDISSFTDGDTPTVQAVAYPWVGDADSILDTNDGVNSFPTPKYTNLTFRLDKVGDHGHTCVTAGGNDGTGAVYASQSEAEAGSAFLTIAAALTALQSYNNTNAGHNDAGGGFIYLGEGTWTLASANGGTLAEWVTITKMSTAAKANVHFQAASAGAAQPTFLKISGVTFDGAQYFQCSNTKYGWVHDCTVNTTGSLTFYQSAYLVATNCTGVFANKFLGYGTTCTQWCLVRGVSCTTYHLSFGYNIIGCKNVFVKERTVTQVASNDGGIFAFNQNYTEDSSNKQIDLGSSTDDIAHGYAIVQNVLERKTSVTQSLGTLFGDSTDNNSNNLIIWHNTLVGSRVNIGYNDGASGGPYNHINWSIKNNIFSNQNIKDDTFGNNASATGGWPVGYHVGGSGNFLRTAASDEWFGEFYGLYYRKGTYATPLDPVYVDNNSYEGSNDGNGDYHLQSSSQAKDIAIELILPYDIVGNSRSASGAAGAYEYATTTSITGASETITEATSDIDLALGMTGTSESVSAATSIIGLILEITALSETLSSGSGDIDLYAKLTGLSDSITDAVGAYGGTLPLTGSSENISAAQSDIDLYLKLQGAASSLTEAIGALSEIGSGDLSGTIASITAAVGVLTALGYSIASRVCGAVGSQFIKGEVGSQLIKGETAIQYIKGEIN